MVYYGHQLCWSLVRREADEYVLEMPVMMTSQPERAQLLEQRLHAADGDLFALLKQQCNMSDLFAER